MSMFLLVGPWGNSSVGKFGGKGSKIKGRGGSKKATRVHISVNNQWIFTKWFTRCDFILNYKMSAHLHNLFMDFPHFKVPNGGFHEERYSEKTNDNNYIFSSVT